MNEPSERLLQGIEFLDQAGFAAGGVVLMNDPHGDRFVQSLDSVFDFCLRFIFHAGFNRGLSFADKGAGGAAVNAVALSLCLVLFIPFDLRLNISQLLPPNYNSNFTKLYFTANPKIVQLKLADNGFFYRKDYRRQYFTPKHNNSLHDFHRFCLQRSASFPFVVFPRGHGLRLTFTLLLDMMNLLRSVGCARCFFGSEESPYTIEREAR